MNDDECKELHEIIKNYMVSKGYHKPSTIIGFLSALYIDIMALHGYDEDFFDSSLDYMKKIYRKHLVREKNKK